MSNPSFRSSRKADLPGIKAIIEATELFPPEFLDDMFHDNTSPQHDEEFWLSCGDDGATAVAYCEPEAMTNGTWNLLLIAVHPEAQSKGVGQKLMLHVEETLRTLGARVLLVETSGTDDFDRTRRFYELNGYDREARIRDYYDSGDDKIVFRKALIQSPAADSSC